MPNQYNGILQPVPPAIPIMSKVRYMSLINIFFFVINNNVVMKYINLNYNQHPAPLPNYVNPRSLPVWKKVPPAPKVTVTKTTQNQKGDLFSLLL